MKKARFIDGPRVNKVIVEVNSCHDFGLAYLIIYLALTRTSLNSKWFLNEGIVFKFRKSFCRLLIAFVHFFFLSANELIYDL